MSAAQVPLIVNAATPVVKSPPLLGAVITGAAGAMESYVTVIVSAGETLKARSSAITLKGFAPCVESVVEYDHVVAPGDLLPTADRLARAIASRGPRAVAAAKRLVRDGMSVPQDAALRTEAAVFATLFDSTDQKEGMSAFLEKRSATFTGK